MTPYAAEDRERAGYAGQASVAVESPGQAEYQDTVPDTSPPQKVRRNRAPPASPELEQRIRQLRSEGKELADIAREAGVSYGVAYRVVRLPERGFQNSAAYTRFLQRAAGVSRREQAREFADYLLSKLAELGKSGAWLGRQVGLTRAAISLYANGTHLPGEDHRQAIREALEAERALQENTYPTL